MMDQAGEPPISDWSPYDPPDITFAKGHDIISGTCFLQLGMIRLPTQYEIERAKALSTTQRRTSAISDVAETVREKKFWT